METLRLIIAGGRDANMTQAQWDHLTGLSDLVDEVVSGCATGIDSWGELWAGKMGIPCKRFPANWKLGPMGGNVRNGQMAAYGNALAIFDGGRGSADMLMKAIEANLWIWDFRSGRDLPCVVVNRHETEDYHYYGGRGSLLGNPYVVGEHGVRGQCIDRFRQHAKESEVLQRAIPYLRGMRLACSCKPKPCHLDVLAEMANEGLSI